MSLKNQKAHPFTFWYSCCGGDASSEGCVKARHAPPEDKVVIEIDDHESEEEEEEEEGEKE